MFYCLGQYFNSSVNTRGKTANLLLLPAVSIILHAVPLGALFNSGINYSIPPVTCITTHPPIFPPIIFYNRKQLATSIRRRYASVLNEWLISKTSFVPSQ